MDNTASSEDESPEAVSFTQSKSSALQKLEMINASLKNDKKRQKQLIQNREQRNIEQKKLKTLPLEILQQADKILQTKKQQSKISEVNLSMNNASNDDMKYESNKAGQKQFVPIGRFCKTSKTTDCVLHFKSSHLYNGRIRRVSSKQHDRLKRKRLIKGMQGRR